LTRKNNADVFEIAAVLQEFEYDASCLGRPRDVREVTILCEERLDEEMEMRMSLEADEDLQRVISEFRVIDLDLTPDQALANRSQSFADE